MIDMKLAVDKFKKDGYIIVGPDIIFSDDEIQRVAKIFDTLLPKWNEGFNVSQNMYECRKTHALVWDRCCALRHRLYRGNGSANTSLDTNFLWGKRIAYSENKYPVEILELIESQKLLKFICGLLGCSNLSFHNGGMIAVYPGCTGEDRKFHQDTVGFLNTNKNLMSDDRFLVNAFVLLSDVDEDLAPMRFIPGSHTSYKYINEHLAKIFRKPATLNHVPQSSNLWEELLPKDLHPPVKFTGKKGSICFLNSTLLHSATENKTENKVRKVIAFNYSNRTHIEFAKNYMHQQKACKYLYDRIKDKQLVEISFKRTCRFFSKMRLKHFLARSYGRIITGLKACRFHSNNILIKLVSKVYPARSKMYLNLGGGSECRSAKVVSLDFNPTISEVSFDLNHLTSLPFEDSRFYGVYSSHRLHFLKDLQVRWWAEEVFRTLKSGGIFRVTVPDIEKLFDAYDAKDFNFFNWTLGPRCMIKYDSWLRAIVRNFADPVVDDYNDDELYRLYQTKTRETFIDFFNSQIEKINDKRFLPPHATKSWWNAKKMIALMGNAGFARVEVKGPNNSNCKIFQGKQFNITRPHASLFVEAVK